MRLPFSYGCSNRRPVGFAAIADQDSSMDLGDSERTMRLSRSGWRRSPGAGIMAPALLLTAGLALLLVPAPGVLAQEGPAHAAPPRDLISGEPVAPPSSVPGQAATADAGDDCERYSAPFFRGSGGFVVAPRDGRSAEMTVQSGSESDGRTVTAGRDGLAVDLLRSSLCFGRNGVFPAQCRISFSGIKGGGWYWVNGDRNAAVAPLVCSEDLGGGAAPLEPGGVQTLPSRFGTGTLFVHDTQGLMGIVPQLSPTGRAGAPNCDRFVAPFFRGKGGFVARPEADRVAEVIVRRDNAVTRKRLTPGADGLAVQLLSDSLCTDANGEAVECQVSFTGIGGGGWYWVNGDRNAAVAPLVCEGRLAGSAAAVPGGVDTSRAAFGTGSLFVHDTQRLMGIVPHLPGAPDDLERVEVRVSVFGGGTVEAVGDGEMNCPDARLCSGWFPAAGSVTLRPRSPFGYTFDHWRGCDSVEDDHCVVALHADRLIFADFTSTQPLTLKENVVVFDENRLRDVGDYDPNSGIMVLTTGAKVDDIGVGSVLASTVVDSDRDFESYFLRRVSDMAQVADAPTIVKTTFANLEDLIASGSLTVRTPLGSEAVSSYELPPGFMPASHSASDLTMRELSDGRRVYEVSRQSDGPERRLVSSRSTAENGPLQKVASPISLRNPISFDLVDVPLGDNVTVKGRIDFDLDAILRADVGWGIHEALGAVAVDSNLSLTVNATHLPSNYEKRLAVPMDKLTVNFICIAVPVGFPPVVVPVPVCPSLSAELWLEVELRAGFQPIFGLKVVANAGVHYLRDHGWARIWSFERTPHFTPPLEAFEARGEIRAGLTPTLKVLVGPKVAGLGPTLSVGPYVGAALFTLTPPRGDCRWDYEAFVGGTAVVGGEFKFLSWVLDPSLTVWDGRFTLPVGREKCVEGEDSSPVPPGSLRFPSTGTDAITVEWSPPRESGGHDAVSYEVIRTHHPERGREGGETRTFSVPDPQFIDSPLSSGTEYCYQVRTVVGAGLTESPLGGRYCESTRTPDGAPPSAPEGLTAESKGAGTIELRWRESSDDEGVSHYAVMEMGSQAHPREAVYVASTEGLKHFATGLNPDTEYCFGVRAFDEAGNASDPSETVCTSTSGSGALRWRYRMRCKGEPTYKAEGFFELDAVGVSRVAVVGSYRDCTGDGTDECTYSLTGPYDRTTGILKGTVYWDFDRKDKFDANLSRTRDTGDIEATVSGTEYLCDPMLVRFDRPGAAAGIATETGSTRSHAVRSDGGTVISGTGPGPRRRQLAGPGG